jgi:hypothetical protein
MNYNVANILIASVSTNFIVLETIFRNKNKLSFKHTNILLSIYEDLTKKLYEKLCFLSNIILQNTEYYGYVSDKTTNSETNEEGVDDDDNVEIYEDIEFKDNIESSYWFNFWKKKKSE